jgi:hypothetical protein
MDNEKMLKLMTGDPNTPEAIAHNEESRRFYLYALGEKTPDCFGKLGLSELLAFIQRTGKSHFRKNLLIDLDLLWVLANRIEGAIQTAGYVA